MTEFAKHITHDQRLEVAGKAEALAFIHYPYQFGAAGPNAYDCSGLALVAWRQGGVELPHNTRLQAEALGMVEVSSITTARLRPGDLVFYHGDIPTSEEPPGHCAVYLREFHGLHLVAQATDEAHGTEVIRMRKYEPPIGYGFVGHS